MSRSRLASAVRLAVSVVSCLVIVTTLAAVVFAGDATYERVGTRESVHRSMFRAPACDQQLCAVEGTTYPMGTLVALHNATAGYVFGSASDLPESPTRGAFNTQVESSTLGELRRAFGVLLGLAAASVLILVGLLLPAKDRLALMRNSAAGAALVAFPLAVLGVFAPQSLLRITRALSGLAPFSFDERYNAHWLYPATYGETVGADVATVVMISAALLAAAAHVMGTRRTTLSVSDGTTSRRRRSQA